MEKRVCECYEIVRARFLDLAREQAEIGGGFPLQRALNFLNIVEDIDTQLVAGGCLTMIELRERREVTEAQIESAKNSLKQLGTVI